RDRAQRGRCEDAGSRGFQAERVDAQRIGAHVGDDAERERDDEGALLAVDALPERHRRTPAGVGGFTDGTYCISRIDSNSPFSFARSSVGRSLTKAPVVSRFAMN